MGYNRDNIRLERNLLKRGGASRNYSGRDNNKPNAPLKYYNRKSNALWDDENSRQKNKSRAMNSDVFSLVAVICCLTFVVLAAGIWELLAAKTSTLSAADVTLVRVIIRTAFCAIGFVPIAIYWKRIQAHYTTLLPLMLIFTYVMLSSVWASSPASSLRDGLSFFVMFCAAFGASLYFSRFKLLSIMAIASILSLLLQFIAQTIMISQTLSGFASGIKFSGAEVATCYLLTLCLAVDAKQSKIFWIVAAVAAAIVGIVINDFQIYVVTICALVIALTEHLSKQVRGYNFFIVCQIVNLIGMFTAIALFNSGEYPAALTKPLDDVGASSVFGAGFLGDDIPLNYSFIAGLGIVGLIYALIFPAYVFGGMVLNRNAAKGLRIFAYGILAIVISGFGEINTFGMVMMTLFIAVCFNTVPPKTQKPQRRRVLNNRGFNR